MSILALILHHAHPPKEYLPYVYGQELNEELPF